MNIKVKTYIIDRYKITNDSHKLSIQKLTVFNSDRDTSRDTGISHENHIGLTKFLSQYSLVTLK